MGSYDDDFESKYPIVPRRPSEIVVPDVLGALAPMPSAKKDLPTLRELRNTVTIVGMTAGQTQIVQTWLTTRNGARALAIEQEAQVPAFFGPRKTSVSTCVREYS